jgi:hypothetical protein
MALPWPQSSETDTIEGRLEHQFPKTNQGVRASVTSLHDERFGDFRPALFTLLAAVGVMLLIACVNVAGLSIARSLVRRRKLRFVAPASPHTQRLIRYLLVESTLVPVWAGRGPGVGLVGPPADRTPGARGNTAGSRSNGSDGVYPGLHYGLPGAFGLGFQKSAAAAEISGGGLLNSGRKRLMTLSLLCSLSLIA